MIDLLPPKVDIDLNVKIRLNVLAGVLEELTDACGLSIKDDLGKGIVNRDVIEEIYVRFYDQPQHVCGEIIFEIDWNKFEFLAKTDNGKVIYSNLDTSKNLSYQLDKRSYDAVKVYVKRTNKKYKVKDVKCSFKYRDKYTKKPEIYEATLKYMNHIIGKGGDIKEQNNDFLYEITSAFKGLDGILKVILKS